MRWSRDERQRERERVRAKETFFARGSVSGATSSSFSDCELRVGSENPQKKLLAPLKKSWFLEGG